MAFFWTGLPGFVFSSPDEIESVLHEDSASFCGTIAAGGDFDLTGVFFCASFLTVFAGILLIGCAFAVGSSSSEVLENSEVLLFSFVSTIGFSATIFCFCFSSFFVLITFDGTVSLVELLMVVLLALANDVFLDDLFSST